MRKRKRKKMWGVLYLIIALILGIAVFFMLPISLTSKRFKKVLRQKTMAAEKDSGKFTEEDIRDLPMPLQQYFRYCGYLGAPKMSAMRASFKNVDFVMSEKKTIKIDYEQINRVKQPDRYAFISSSLFGIPFEGFDSYENGTGSMKGVLAKVIPLFDQRGERMNRACLVTWLAECLMVPSAALQDFVSWKAVDRTHVMGKITWKGISASGIFSFSQTGELLEFRTGDRAAIDMKGNETKAEWSAYFYSYQRENGLLQPKIIQSTWHYPKGDCIYFNQGKQAVKIQYE